MTKSDVFYKIVKTNKYLHFLGKNIIRHRKQIENINPSKTYKEHQKQYERINEYIKTQKKLNNMWKYNQNSINRYWTGFD